MQHDKKKYKVNREELEIVRKNFSSQKPQIPADVEKNLKKKELENSALKKILDSLNKDLDKK